jgi:hypothetical protein
MSYMRKRLAPGETMVAEGRFHWSQYAAAWLALILLGWVIIGILIWARELARLNTTEFVVTSRRVVLKRGWLSVHVDELTLNSVEGAHVDQNMPGRIFGFGKLMLHGRGDTTIAFPTMARPAQFRAAIEGARIHEEDRPIEHLAQIVEGPTPARRLGRREQRQVAREQRAH